MKKSQTAGRGILACLFVYLLIQIYYLSSYILPSATGEPWKELASLFLVQSVMLAVCILSVFIYDFLQMRKKDRTSPFGSVLLVSGDGKIKNEWMLQGRHSFIITGKKGGKEVFLEDTQVPEPGKYLYGICNLTGGCWYLEADSSQRPVGLKRENENVIYRLKAGVPYRLCMSDVIYADTYKIVIK